ncbi:MAG TPA: S8 family serine peptidase [Candidatus Limnocylindria bacterium]|nr:S8 family serine peptidase [Candidatus Limnocylindria bacterium]
MSTRQSASVPGHRFARVTGSRFAGAVVIGLLLVPLFAGPVSARGPVSSPSGQTIAATHVVDDSWIVQLQPGVSPAADAPGLARLAGGRVGLVFPLAVNGFQFHGSATAAQALARLPQVASVTPDRPMHLIESLPNGIERIWAFDNDTPANSAFHQGFRGNGARIAVLDTGVDVDHPDLVGAIDHSLGKNCVNPALPPEDGYGHGTHVSGTALAPLNGVGVVGVAPEARLVPVKIFDDAGNSSEALVLCGFNHVLALNADGNPSNDVDVMSMSFGEDRSWGDCVTDPLHTAVCNAYAAGIIMVAGAGNSAVNAGTFVPAAFPEVVSVSALADFDAARGGLAGCGLVPDLGWFDCDDTFAFFSNYGASVDVIAPGVSVFSTTKNGGYATQSGTSMATPHVSGVVALMAAANPGLTPASAVAFLRESGECPDGTVAGADGTCSGQGTWADDPDGTPEPLANALRAALAAGGTPPTPTAPAAPTLTSATPGDGSVALAWTTPADGGSALTGYEVWRGTSPGSEAFHVAPVGLGTTYTDTTDVTNGTTYYYQVRAVNAVDPGPLSNELSATPAAPPPTVSRTGGTVSNFGSATSNAGSIGFSLPSASNALVAMVSVSSTTVTVTSLTWKPDPANAGADQALTFVGRRVAPSGGAVEIWALLNPTPGQSGSAVAHTLSGSVKRIMGLHALAGVATIGTPVGAGANATAIGVTVPSVSGGLVLDVLYGQNSTTGYTAGSGQTERWDTNTTSGLNNLRGTGSEETGASSVAMTWTSKKSTNMALLGVSFNPVAP